MVSQADLKRGRRSDGAYGSHGPVLMRRECLSRYWRCLQQGKLHIINIDNAEVRLGDHVAKVAVAPNDTRVKAWTAMRIAT